MGWNIPGWMPKTDHRSTFSPIWRLWRRIWSAVITMSMPLRPLTVKEKIPFLSVDLMPAQPGLTPYGVPNDLAGRLGGDLLVQGLKERLASTWKDQEVFFVGLTASSIPACVDRITAAGQAVKAGLGLDEPHLLTIDASGTGGNPSSALLAAIDAHPQAVFALIPCWDQLGDRRL